MAALAYLCCRKQPPEPNAFVALWRGQVWCRGSCMIMHTSLVLEYRYPSPTSSPSFISSIVLTVAWPFPGHLVYSRKAQELKAFPHAAITFWWGALHRSVRFEGEVAMVSEEESDEYFNCRPTGSKVRKQKHFEEVSTVQRRKVRSSLKLGQGVRCSR